MGNAAYATTPSFSPDGLSGISMEEYISKSTNVIDLNLDDALPDDYRYGETWLPPRLMMKLI
ncbi:MAG: hypothetical protein JRN37_02970 [Nitrososphaerota archaeon]|nr:hypothetical protein [Nitrososphaerota archaeon]MDG7038112.1 hypothetical protein [Nitrososphaerota archaeon]